MHYKLPLVFEPQPEGGFTVTSPLLPELITEGDTVEDALENVRDALAAVIEAYQETGRTLPPNLVISDPKARSGRRWSSPFHDLSRDGAKKLTSLGCQELPRTATVHTASGSTRRRIASLSCPTGEATT